MQPLNRIRQKTNRARHGNRHGFTLIELLVSVGIILILATLSISAVSVALETDRISGAARQIQSYLEGARDRAIYAGEPRGVRFLPDPTDNNLVTSMIFIGQSDSITGTLTLDPANASDFALVQLDTVTPSFMNDLIDAKLLSTGAKIRIAGSPSVAAEDVDDEPVYNVTDIDIVLVPEQSRLRLATDHLDLSTQTPGLQFELELAPAPLPNQEPTRLPSNTVIDLRTGQSQVPGSWISNVDRRDIMFSPRGTVTGPAAAQGLIHFALVDRKDVDLLRSLGQTGGTAAGGEPGLKEGEELIITVFTRTGNISRHPVNITDKVTNSTGMVPPDGLADDPFFFAETGATAK